jgi:hypothetical protein
MMKRCISILLLLALFVNTLGYFLVFKCTQFVARQEMLDQIRNGSYPGELTLLNIVKPWQDKHFRWKEHGEFVYFGRLYDVVATKKKGDTICFFCIPDKREERLIHQFTLLNHHHQNQGTHEKSRPVSAMLYHLITIALIQDHTPVSDYRGDLFTYPCYHSSTAPGYLDQAVLPPEMA